MTMTTMKQSNNQRRTQPLALAVRFLAALLAFGLIWPQQIELLRGDDPLRHYDFAINTAHSHLASVFVTSPYVSVLTSDS